MIGRITYQSDISIYLYPGELATLPRGIIEGALVKPQNAKTQGLIRLSVNEKRENENGIGIGIDDKKYWKVEDNYIIEVFLGPCYYDRLIERGKVETRQSMQDGSKVEVIDTARIDCHLEIEDLEWYRDNKLNFQKMK